jgi:hypothetical protein
LKEIEDEESAKRPHGPVDWIVGALRFIDQADLLSGEDPMQFLRSS